MAHNRVTPYFSMPYGSCWRLVSSLGELPVAQLGEAVTKRALDMEYVSHSVNAAFIYTDSV